jgi:phosphate starvation-inducible membrane PsiE
MARRRANLAPDMTENAADTTAHVRKAGSTAKGMVDDFGTFLVESFHLLALFGIGAATVWAAVSTFISMVARSQASIEDLLLLFIYLEIGAMVGIYFKTNRMPVRFLLYVAITALTRHLIVVINVSHATAGTLEPEYNVITIAGAILLLAAAVLLVRFASFKYPSAPSAKDRGDIADADHL